jgi:hypothetical protein
MLSAIAAMSLTSFVAAGPISAIGSVAGAPPVLVNPQPGMAIPTENIVNGQYRSLGLDNGVFRNLSLSALSTIDGVTALVPVVSNGNGYNLDYGGFVGFQVLNRTIPDGQRAGTTNFVSVEFIGPNAASGFLYAMSRDGGILGSTMADDGIGPNGGRLATLQIPDIGMFAAWSMYDQGDAQVMVHNVWGVSAISIDDPFPTVGGGSETPEPATMSLAGIGILGALSAAWKRRRRAA